MHSECINCPNTYTDDGAMYPIDPEKCTRCNIIPCRDRYEILKPIYGHLTARLQKQVRKWAEWFKEEKEIC